MKRENRDVKIQVRITQSEKNMLEEMGSYDREFSISKLVREAINKRYKECKEGVGSFTIG
jgi:hypothetical protein